MKYPRIAEDRSQLEQFAEETEQALAGIVGFDGEITLTYPAGHPTIPAKSVTGKGNYVLKGDGVLFVNSKHGGSSYSGICIYGSNVYKFAMKNFSSDVSIDTMTQYPTASGTKLYKHVIALSGTQNNMSIELVNTREAAYTSLYNITNEITTALSAIYNYGGAAYTLHRKASLEAGVYLVSSGPVSYGAKYRQNAATFSISESSVVASDPSDLGDISFVSDTVTAL